jgi:hypothetical protein
MKLISEKRLNENTIKWSHITVQAAEFHERMGNNFIKL